METAKPPRLSDVVGKSTADAPPESAPPPTDDSIKDIEELLAVPDEPPQTIADVGLVNPEIAEPTPSEAFYSEDYKPTAADLARLRKPARETYTPPIMEPAPPPAKPNTSMASERALSRTEQERVRGREILAQRNIGKRKR